MTPTHPDLLAAAARSADALASFAVLDSPPEAAYDDIAQLARDLCDAPVALVTLFDTDRQWFKASVGFDADCTELGDALCANAIDAGDVLVIPDLATDPRTSTNVFVTGPANARFYAGAPLRTADGIFLGTLCVIDMAARPQGLTAAQTNGLRTLADQVMTLLELRRALRERDAALRIGANENRRLRDNAQILTANEAHWRGLFEGMREGFMVGRVLRDDTGRANDWLHLEANAAFHAVAGLPQGAVVGHTLRELAPDTPDRWIEFVAGVVEHGRADTFTNVPGRDRRLYEGRAFAIGDDQFAVIFLDVTERLRAAARQEALIAIGDQLRDLDTLSSMTEMVCKLVGEALDVKRAGFGRMDHTRETIVTEPDWTVPGFASIAGTHRFADYGDLLKELTVGAPLVIEDVHVDPRTAADPGPLERLGIRSLVNMPVRERGRTVALLLVHDDVPRVWTTEELTFVRDVSDRLEYAILRLDAEERRIVQNQELSHRLKNTLAIVQAIASQTLKTVTERSAIETFERRLATLATAHDVLLESAWKIAPLDDVVRSILYTAGFDDRVRIDGPPIELSPRAVLSVSLLLHELATNAAKYGALSTSNGSVTVRWSIRRLDGQRHLQLTWVERGGPPATPPTRRGFGSRLIKMGLVGTGAVDLTYDDTGFSARMSAPFEDLTIS